MPVSDPVLASPLTVEEEGDGSQQRWANERDWLGQRR